MNINNLKPICVCTILSVYALGMYASAGKHRALRCVEATLRLPQSMSHRISDIGLQSQSSQSLQPHMLVFAYFIWFSFNVCSNHVVGQKYAFRITQRFTVCIPLEMFSLQLHSLNVVERHHRRWISSVNTCRSVNCFRIWKFIGIHFASFSKLFS